MKHGLSRHQFKNTILDFMNKQFGAIPYLIVLGTDLIGVYTGNETLRYFTKPLLMPVLVVYFILTARVYTSRLKKWIVLALLFSCLGDILLMFEALDNSFFIFGLVAFLTAHIFYILFYGSVLRLDNLKRNYWLFVPVLIYYFTLVYILTPHLGEMKLPVRMYGAVISYMLVQALQVARIKNKEASWMMIIGAILFVTSDSILAINKFYGSFEYAGILVMLTYGLAQLLIVLGASKYITSQNNKFVGQLNRRM